MGNMSRELPRGRAVAVGGRGLRILMVAPQPFFRARGTPFSVLHRIRVLVNEGHRVDLVTYPFGDHVAFNGLRIIRCEKPPLVRDVRIGPSIGKLALDLSLYRATVRALRMTRYDVIHSHEEAAFFAVGLARRHGLLHVYDMHSSLPQQLRNFRAYDRTPVRRLFTVLERYVLRGCDGVITICPDLANQVSRACPGKLHEMIENTADNSRVFRASEDDVRTGLGIGRDSRVILYTGTFEAYQGLDLLLRAFVRVRSADERAHLLLVGGRPTQLARYRALAESLGCDRSVSFTGTVHPSRIPGYVQASDLIVSPRCSGTNTPLKIYEYMRSNRPLVATDLPTHTQVLNSDVACLVPPNQEGIAEGILRLLSDPRLASRLAEAAARKAEHQFSDAAYARKVNGFYERLLKAADGLPAGVTVSAT